MGTREISARTGRGIAARAIRTTAGGSTLRIAAPETDDLIDLSGTVNPYGPPRSVVDALSTASARHLQMAACEACAEVKYSYSAALGVPATELAVFRGTADFAFSVAEHVPAGEISIADPAPASLLRTFPERPGGPRALVALPSLDAINQSMSTAQVTMISNPNRMLGTQLDPSSLTEIALAHPENVLVVDETFIDFLADPQGETMIGANADNLIVLRTISEFFGIPAVPVAVAWCIRPQLVARLTGRGLSREEDGQDAVQCGRQIGPVDALVTAAALDAAEWAERSKLLLAYNAMWLSQVLARTSGRVVENEVGVHFRAVLTKHAKLMAGIFRSHGVRVLELSGPRTEAPSGLRILAPSFEYQGALEAAVTEITTRINPSMDPGKEESGFQTDAGS